MIYRQLRKLSSPALPWVPIAVIVACAVEVGLRVLPLTRLAAMLGVPLFVGAEAQTQVEERKPSSDRTEEPRIRAARAVQRRWPLGRNTPCLRLSLLIGCLIRRRAPRLQLGVTRVDGEIRAHAWVVVGGVALDLTADEYIPFPLRVA